MNMQAGRVGYSAGILLKPEQGESSWGSGHLRVKLILKNPKFAARAVLPWVASGARSLRSATELLPSRKRPVERWADVKNTLIPRLRPFLPWKVDFLKNRLRLETTKGGGAILEASSVRRNDLNVRCPSVVLGRGRR